MVHSRPISSLLRAFLPSNAAHWARRSGCAVAAVAVLAAVSACSRPSPRLDGDRPLARPSDSVIPGHLDPSLVVATVGGNDVTAAELDELVASDLKNAAREYSDTVHRIRREALEQMVADRVIGLEADARGMTKEAFFEAEVMRAVPEPDEEAVAEFFEKMVRPRYDVPLEMVAPQIRMQMHREAMAMKGREVIETLKAKHGVTISLPVPDVDRVEVAATGPSKGPETAPVTIVAFSDFECPFCARANASLDQVMQAYGDNVRLVFRQFPLSFHANAQKAAEASLCADDQGKFWEMHDKLFAEQDELEVPELKAHAASIGLNQEAFDSCLDSGEKASVVAADLEAGQNAGVTGTPAFFINGRLLAGAQPFEQFQQIIDAELANN